MSKKLGILVLGIMVLVGLAACTEMGTEVSGYYVSVDINPSIEFVVDDDDVVESYVFLNEDAAILCSDLDFVGMNVDDAIELFVEAATAAGYIDPDGDDNAVLITVLTDDEEDENQEVRTRICERIQKRLNTHFAKKYINSVVLTEEFTQEDLLAEAEALNVSPGKLKLAYAAMFTDETLVKEDLLDMPVKDILAIIRESHSEAFGEYKEAQWTRLREMKQEKIEEHKDAVQAHLDANPEMTQEQVQAYIDNYKAQVREETQEQWRDRLEQWKQSREENQEGNANSDETPDE